MGCNTSQELKTKEGIAAADNVNGDLELATNATAPSLDGQDAAAQCDSGCSPNSNHHHHHNTNHAKTNSILTNGDAQQQQQQQHSTQKSATPKKYQHQLNGTSATTTSGTTQGSTGLGSGAGATTINGERQCDKAELTEFNDADADDDNEEAKAATKIQAVFRGHQVRETMKKSETKTTSGAAANNGTSTTAAGAAAGTAAAAAAAAIDAAEPTKEELEAEFDPNDKELCDAALKIQSTFRGHLARKLGNKDAVPEDEDIKEITKKVAEELDIDLTDPELHKAATKIQASFRGHKTRKDVGTE